MSFFVGPNLLFMKMGESYRSISHLFLSFFLSYLLTYFFPSFSIPQGGIHHPRGRCGAPRHSFIRHLLRANSCHSQSSHRHAPGGSCFFAGSSRESRTEVLPHPSGLCGQGVALHLQLTRPAIYRAVGSFPGLSICTAGILIKYFKEPHLCHSYILSKGNIIPSSNEANQTLISAYPQSGGR